MKPQLINKEIKIEEGDIVKCVSTQVFAAFQSIFVHIIRAEHSCELAENIAPSVRIYSYKNMNDFTYDRHILESTVK